MTYRFLRTFTMPRPNRGLWSCCLLLPADSRGQPVVMWRNKKWLNDAREAQIPWKKWGPYLSERQWGMVREDYSENGGDV